MADNPLYRPGGELLRARGYRRVRPYQVFVKEPFAGFRFTVFLNATTGPGTLSLDPQLGVRHDDVSRWVAACWGVDPSRMGRTVGAPLSKPTPGLPHWYVARGEEERNAETWARLAHDFDEYGEPWLLERTDPHRLVAALREWEGGPTSRMSLPVLLWILGDTAGAREAAEAVRGTPINGPVVDYDAFADRLLAEIDSHPGGPPDRGDAPC